MTASDEEVIQKMWCAKARKYIRDLLEVWEVDDEHVSDDAIDQFSLSQHAVLAKSKKFRGILIKNLILAA